MMKFVGQMDEKPKADLEARVRPVMTLGSPLFFRDVARSCGAIGGLGRSNAHGECCRWLQIIEAFKVFDGDSSGTITGEPRESKSPVR